MVVKVADLKVSKFSESIYSHEPPADLIESITEYGVLVPIWIDKDNQIISGHRRVNACKQLKIATIEAELRDYSDSLVIEANRYRDKGIQEIYNETRALKEIETKKARERQSIGHLNAPQYEKEKPVQENFPELEKGQVRDKVAEKVGMSGKQLEKIETIVEKKPELIKAIDAGEKSIHSAYQQIKQEEAQTDVASKKEKYKTALKNSLETNPIIYQQNCVEFLQRFEDRSQDLLLTDPPYLTDIEGDIEDFLNSWLYLALDKVKDTGRAYIFTGAYPEEFFTYLKKLLTHTRFIVDNPLIWTYRNTLGQTPKDKYKLNYQLIFHLYTKDSPELDTSITNEMFSVQDINAPDGRLGNRFYKFQKSEELARRLIIHSTKENDQIIDCFAGSGIFLIVASKLKRKAVGCDISPEALAIAKELGCDIR